jgi:hypothetical protein
VYALSLVALVAIWWRYRRLAAPSGSNGTGGREPAKESLLSQFRLTAAVSILLMIATSLHTHVQDYVFAFISCIWIWRDLLNSGSLGFGKIAWIRRLVEYYPGLSWIFLFVGMLSSVIFVQPFFLWGVLLFALVITSQEHHAGGGNDQQSAAHD